MESASILDGYRNTVRTLVMVFLLALTSCSSPLDLDVDREMSYRDDIVHPRRMSLLYYFGDSAYEAIYIDPALLASIEIDTATRPFVVTIPQLNTPLFACSASEAFSPIIQGFGFSTIAQPCNERIVDIVNRSTFMNVETLQRDGSRREYLWVVDGVSRRMRLGFVASPENRLIKGRIALSVADPDRPRVLSYYGILTIEY